MAGEHPMGRAIGATRRQIARALFWNRFSVGCGWGLLAAGVTILLGKFTVPAVVFTGLGLALAVPLIALATALRRHDGFTLEECAVLLDRRGKLDGLPLFYLAYPDSAWIAQAIDASARAESAVPRLDPWPFTRRVLPGLLLVAATLLLPPQEGLMGPKATARNSAAVREVEKLAAKIEQLEDKKLLQKDEVQRLRDELKTLDESAREKSFTQEKWEGLDHLGEMVQQSARERASEMQRTASAVTALAGALESGAMDEAVLREKAEGLERALTEMPDLPGAKQLQQMLKQMGESGDLQSLDKEAVSKAMDELKDFLDEQLKKSEELAEGS